MSRALILETRHRTEQWIANRRDVLEGIALEIKRVGETIAKESVDEALDSIEALKGYTAQAEALIKDIAVHEMELK